MTGEMTDDMTDEMIEAQETRAERGFRLEVPPSLVSIAICRSAVRRVVTFRDPDAESSFLVALTEIVANAIDEHDRLGLGRPIVLEVGFGTEDVVRVIDSGDGYPGPAAAQTGVAPDADHLQERGRGVTLAQALVPRIVFDASGPGTVVTLPCAGFGIVR